MAADTLRPARLGAAFALSPILDEADRDGQASRIVVMDGGLYRLAFVPVATSAPGAWLCAGFAIDDQRVADVRRRTGLQVSVLRRVDSGFVVHASTLACVERDDLKRALAASRTAVVIRADGSLLAQAKIDHLSGNRWSGRHPFGQSLTGPILSRESVTL